VFLGQYPLLFLVVVSKRLEHERLLLLEVLQLQLVFVLQVFQCFFGFVFSLLLFVFSGFHSETFELLLFGFQHRLHLFCFQEVFLLDQQVLAVSQPPYLLVHALLIHCYHRHLLGQQILVSLLHLFRFQTVSLLELVHPVLPLFDFLVLFLFEANVEVRLLQEFGFLFG